MNGRNRERGRRGRNKGTTVQRARHLHALRLKQAALCPIYFTGSASWGMEIKFIYSTKCTVFAVY